MLTSILSITLFIIFLVLGAFHFYWLFGGRWGADQVIPRKSDQEDFIPIPKFATLIVAVGLVFLGVIYLDKSGLKIVDLPDWLTGYAGWIIPSVFILRAIGDFNYVGMFKKIKDTDFANADSKLFVPLCICISILGLLIQVL